MQTSNSKKKILAYIGMKKNMKIGTVNGILWINGYEGVTYCGTRVFRGVS